MLDHTVLPGDGALLRGLGLRRGGRRREHGGVVQLGGLVLELRGQQVELGTGEVATGGTGGALGLGRAWGLLAAPVSRGAL